MNYQEILPEVIPLIKEWINKQQDNKEVTETTSFKDLTRILPEIEQEADYSEESFDDIRFLLKQFDSLPLKIKRIFNIA